MRIDVPKSPELLATIYALRSVDKTIAKKVRQYTKAIAQPEWKKELAERANTKIEHRVILDTSVVTVSNQNVRVQSGSKGRPLSGGLNPKVHYAAVEFGMHPHKTTYSRKGRKGGKHQVTRMIGTGLPAVRRRGPFYKTVENMTPRLARLWVQTTVRTIAEALEGKQE